MSTSDEPPTIPPTRAMRSQPDIAPTAAMRGPVPGELPPTSLNYSPRARATSGRKWLPDNLRAQVTIVDVLQSGAQADVYLVEDSTGKQRVAKVYHSSTQIKEAVLGKVRGVQLPHVVTMYDFGHDDGHWWETQEYAAHGTLLDLIGSDGPKLSSALVREIVIQINQALTSLHGIKIEHRDLKPANVLVRSREPLDLALTDFGVSSNMEGSVRNSGLGGTSLYAPPEGQGTFAGGLGSDSGEDAKTIVFKERWDNWSLGMMIVEMLTGKHPFAGQDPNTVVMRLIIKNVDELVAGVTDANWRNLCRGLLRRDSTLRWGNEEVGLWLKNPNDVSLKVAEEGASATAGYSFSGRLYYSLQELGEAFYGNWAAARRTWEIDRNGLLRWIQNDLGQAVIVDAIEKAIASVRKLNVPNGLRADTETLTIATLLAPAALPVVNGIELSLKNISAYAELAKTDPTAKKKLVDLLHSQVLRIVKASPDGVRLASISDAWESACRSYEQHRSDLGRHGVNVPDLSDEARVTLFAAQFPDSATLGILRERASRANSADARSSDWFARMGQANSADAGTLMIMPFASRTAEESARRERDQRRYEWALLTYGNLARRVLGAAGGLLLGIATAYIPGFVVYWPIAWIWGESSATNIALFWVLGCVLFGSLMKWTELERLVGNPENEPAKVMSKGAIYSVLGGICIAITLGISIPKVQTQYARFTPEAQEVERIAGHSAQVWTTSGVAASRQDLFPSQAAHFMSITMRYNRSGEFRPDDEWQFLVTKPDGTTGSCDSRECGIRRDSSGFLQPGEYTVLARTKYRVLASWRFIVE